MAEQNQKPKPTVYQDAPRINKYKQNELLFTGDHFDAFNIKVGDINMMRKEYQKLRYVAVNFAGMLSRLAADTLFGFEEYPRISFKDKKRAEWFEEVEMANMLSVQMYESALANSYRGDAVFRIRATADKKLVIEDLNVETYHALYNKGNIRAEVDGHVLQWNTKHPDVIHGGKTANIVVQEIHKKGVVETKAFVASERNEFVSWLTDDQMKKMELVPEVKTNVDEFLVFHVPNYRINSRFYGLDDYTDLLPLMFAINNRLTKMDNVLDKHGDPILAAPSGVLDENGEVKKEAFGLIEMPDDGSGVKPEYIVWDAKLESTFSMIDKLVEYLFLTSETSMAAFGMDKEGQAESGRALKFKMLRTLAKKHRKQMYYDAVMKKMLVVAQKFAAANGLTCNGVKVPKGEAETPQIEWQDGIINDEVEMMDVEERKLDNQLTRRVDAIMRLEGLSQEDAEEKAKQIMEDEKKNKPSVAVNPFNPDDPVNKEGDEDGDE